MHRSKKSTIPSLFTSPVEWVRRNGYVCPSPIPGDLDKRGIRQYIREDRVVYSDGSQPGGIDLWPTQADGLVHPLYRIDNSLYGNDPNNWRAAEASPGL